MMQYGILFGYYYVILRKTVITNQGYIKQGPAVLLNYFCQLFVYTFFVYSVIQVCRYNCPDPVCPEDTATAPAVNVQASITAQPAYGGDSLSNSIPSKLN